MWLPASDPLQRFCDSAFHWDCYAEWQHRKRFARSYFEFWVEFDKSNPYWWQGYLDADILVSVNPQLESAWIHLAETGSRLEVALSAWSAWLQEAIKAEHSLESKAIGNAKATLRVQRPTSESLLGSVDWDSKADLFQQLAEKQERGAAEDTQRRQEIARHNALCAEVLPAIRGSGYRCPSCEQNTEGFRLSSREGQKSLLICRQCGHVVDPQLFTL